VRRQKKTCCNKTYENSVFVGKCEKIRKRKRRQRGCIGDHNGYFKKKVERREEMQTIEQGKATLGISDE
jgi:hypothetical protein